MFCFCVLLFGSDEVLVFDCSLFCLNFVLFVSLLSILIIGNFLLFVFFMDWDIGFKVKVFCFEICLFVGRFIFFLDFFLFVSLFSILMIGNFWLDIVFKVKVFCFSSFGILLLFCFLIVFGFMEILFEFELIGRFLLIFFFVMSFFKIKENLDCLVVGFGLLGEFNVFFLFLWLEDGLFLGFDLFFWIEIRKFLLVMFEREMMCVFWGWLGFNFWWCLRFECILRVLKGDCSKIGLFLVCFECGLLLKLILNVIDLFFSVVLSFGLFIIWCLEIIVLFLFFSLVVVNFDSIWGGGWFFDVFWNLILNVILFLVEFFENLCWFFVFFVFLFDFVNKFILIFLCVLLVLVVWLVFLVIVIFDCFLFGVIFNFDMFVVVDSVVILLWILLFVCVFGLDLEVDEFDVMFFFFLDVFLVGVDFLLILGFLLVMFIDGFVLDCLLEYDEGFICVIVGSFRFLGIFVLFLEFF